MAAYKQDNIMFQITGLERLRLVECKRDHSSGYDTDDDSCSSSEEGSYANDSAIVAKKRMSGTSVRRESAASGTRRISSPPVSQYDEDSCSSSEEGSYANDSAIVAKKRMSGTSMRRESAASGTRHISTMTSPPVSGHLPRRSLMSGNSLLDNLQQDSDLSCCDSDEEEEEEDFDFDDSFQFCVDMEEKVRASKNKSLTGGRSMGCSDSKLLTTMPIAFDAFPTPGQPSSPKCKSRPAAA